MHVIRKPPPLESDIGVLTKGVNEIGGGVGCPRCCEEMSFSSYQVCGFGGDRKKLEHDWCGRYGLQLLRWMALETYIVFWKGHFDLGFLEPQKLEHDWKMNSHEEKHVWFASRFEQEAVIWLQGRCGCTITNNTYGANWPGRWWNALINGTADTCHIEILLL